MRDSIAGMVDHPAGAGPIGILCALPEEQALLVSALGDPPPLPGIALEARRGRLFGLDVIVAAAGVGKVSAAISATLLAERLGCRALILSGVAGGVSDSLRIGDIIVADRVVDIDYGRLTDDGLIVYQPGTLPIPEVTSDPGYRLPAELVQRVSRRIEASGLPATMGTIVSGDAFLASPGVRERLAAEWGALAIEMEGAAVCAVAERFGLPWLVVRALSDRAGEGSLDDFRAFVDTAAASSARLVQTLLPAFEA